MNFYFSKNKSKLSKKERFFLFENQGIQCCFLISEIIESTKNRKKSEISLFSLGY
jgi:hypothetical protein